MLFSNLQCVSVVACMLASLWYARLLMALAIELAVFCHLQAILLRDACLSEVYAYEVLERSARA
jgi:hypothetical protein